jgi:diacylglycerol kinase (ATP)
METLLIINPYSRNKKSGKLAKRIITYLKQKNFKFDFKEVQKFSDAYDLSVRANKSGIDNIIAIGGDGTINKVINGFFDDNGKKISRSRFGVIHTGTSPDFCKSYNIPINILKAADVIINNKIREIPIGMIKLQATFQTKGKNNSNETNYFACCANIGLGASLARSASSGIRAYLGDFGGTFVSFMKILFTYKGTDYKILLDNKPNTFKNVFNISVGITPYIASGIKVFIEHLPNDQLYVLKAANISLANIFPLIKGVYSGKKFINTSYLSLSQASHIEIENNSIHPEVEFDGDPMGYLPCKIDLAQDRLPLLSN